MSNAHRQNYTPPPVRPVVYRTRRPRVSFSLWLLLALFLFGTLALRAWLDVADPRRQAAPQVNCIPAAGQQR